jgi:YesN/AraC family two-component response regulator
MKTIKLFLIEDHQMVREGLKLIFDRDDNFSVVGEAQNGVEGLKLLSKHGVDVVLTDINMPVMDGVQFMKELRIKRPDRQYSHYTHPKRPFPAF